MNEKEKGLVSALMQDPGLLEKVAVPKKILRGQCLEIFNEIKRQFDKSQSFDYVSAADELEMKASGLLFDGFHRLNVDGLKIILKEIEKDQLRKKLLEALNKETRIVEKTGTARNSKKIKELFFKLDSLDEKELITSKISDVKKRPVNWLWEGRIPKGMMTLIAGHPGIGKSFFITWLLAALSKGEALPDEKLWTQGEKTRPYSSLLIAAEDDPNCVIRPRLEGNKADLSKIEILNNPLDFSLDNLTDLEAILNSRPGLCVVVIDPLNAFLGGKFDYFRDPDVRRRLGPLVDIAKKRDLAIIGIAHFNKREDSELITRIGGSMAFPGVARSTLGISYDVRDNDDPDSQDTRLLFSIKMNLRRKPDVLAFKIKDDLSILFEKESIKMDPDTIFSKEQREKTQHSNFIKRWLIDLLRSGEKYYPEILKAATEEKISRATLYRTRDKLSKQGEIEVITHGYGKDKKSLWRLKSA